MKRILWNERPGRGLGLIDEIVLRDVARVHIEQMDDRCWWIGIYLDDTADGPYWMGNFVADSRMRFIEQENHGVEWDEDKSHEEAR